MSKLKKQLFIITILVLNLILLTNQNVFATNTARLLEKVEYSEEFKEWAKLPEKERKKIIMPLPYTTKKVNGIYQNPLYSATVLKASLDEKFSLKDVIPENLIIKDQMQTGSCWTFAGISSLETNMALYNHKNSLALQRYDFSERHMEYATSRIFAGGEENQMGYNRKAGDGGNFLMAESYLANGVGAIDEADMPFENNENTIDISEIQGKKITTQVYDTAEFNDYARATGTKKTEIMNEIKQHIQNYGSVYASIHGDSSEENCYNNTTGAKYCNNSTTHRIDHAVSIIGWDDNYSVDNFIEGAKPTSKGAWIVRNSWGERIEYPLEQLKVQIFNANREYCIAQGWDSPEKIPNAVIEERLGYIIEGNIAYMPVGDNGLIYVSYEDANVSSGLWGIEKATNETSYDNIYRYDEFYPIDYIQVNSTDIILCNIFNKKTEGPEYLNQVALNLIETGTCKVYVNPNGTSMSVGDLQEVTLKAGESELLNPGYHTLEFANSVEINSESFVVAIKIKGTREAVAIALENKSEYTDDYDYVTIEDGKCFVSAIVEPSAEYDWIDLGKLSQVNAQLPNGDGTIKAFTTNELYDESLKNIEIITPPNKTTYIVGENFDKTGMVVKANYRSKITPSLILDNSSYSIENGTNLADGQTSVTITYDGKSVLQPITVSKNMPKSLTIKTPPNKTEYKEGQHFDRTGMIVEATYEDDMTRIVEDYTITNGYNVKANQTQVTISYGGKTVQQPITVTPNPLMGINVTKAPNKTTYTVGQNFDKEGMIITGTYQDGDTNEIIEYNISDGTNLTKEQKVVTIEYEGKTTTQAIIVEDNKGAAKNSNFDNANCTITSMKYYTFSNKDTQEYFIVDTLVKGMTKTAGNDSYEYFYYLSLNQNENDIQDWVKIKENQSANDKLQFVINTKDVKNYAEITNNEITYIYIKEVVKKDESQSVVISKAMKIGADGVIPEIYLDNVKINNRPPSEPEKPNNGGDNTIATSRIPNAGIVGILIIISILLVAGIIAYIRYRVLSKYVK